MRNEIVHNEFLYYLAHQAELVKLYEGKAIILVNHEVKGAFSTEDEAYLEALKSYPLGTFLIQTCSPGPDAYTIKAHPRYSMH